MKEEIIKTTVGEIHIIDGVKHYVGGMNQEGECFKDLNAWETGQGVIFIGEYQLADLEGEDLWTRDSWLDWVRQELAPDYNDEQFIQYVAKQVLEACDWTDLSTELDECLEDIDEIWDEWFTSTHTDQKTIEIPITEYGQEFIESANNLTTNELQSIYDFLRQGARALLSRHLSAITPNANGEQILDTCIILEWGLFGLSTNDMPRVTRIRQHQGGEINITIDGAGEDDFDHMDIESILEITQKINGVPESIREKS